MTGPHTTAREVWLEFAPEPKPRWLERPPMRWVLACWSRSPMAARRAWRWLVGLAAGTWSVIAAVLPATIGLGVCLGFWYLVYRLVVLVKGGLGL